MIRAVTLAAAFISQRVLLRSNVFRMTATTSSGKATNSSAVTALLAVLVRRGVGHELGREVCPVSAADHHTMEYFIPTSRVVAYEHFVLALAAFMVVSLMVLVLGSVSICWVCIQRKRRPVYNVMTQTESGLSVAMTQTESELATVTTQTQAALLPPAVLPVSVASRAAAESIATESGSTAAGVSRAAVPAVEGTSTGRTRVYAAGNSTTKPTSVLNECVRAGHRTVTGRNETHAYISCRLCLFKHSWSAWEEPDFQNFPAVQVLLQRLWDQLVRDRRA